MTDEPRPRKILSLKNPPTRPLGPEPIRKAAPPPPPPPPPAQVFAWKCKPCGAGFNVGDELAEDVVIRCPSCNAKIGVVADFRADPTPTKLRARPVAPKG
jgi:DNA-directed RNA polymerase subunit RPC12/RpoP